MELQTLFDNVVSFAKECGMIQKTYETPGNTVVRNNATGKKDNRDEFLKGAYFGFIRDEEEPSGGYHDFSLVIFPQIDDKACVIALGVGSLGFANDYDKASLPGVRRLFSKLRREGSKSFFKNDFSDIESPSMGLINEIKINYKSLLKVIETYKNVLPAAEIIDFSDPNKEEDSLKSIKQWIATYAKFRGWASNAGHRNCIIDNSPKNKKVILDVDKIEKSLLSEKYVVLQGAPGTGKTFSALEIAAKPEFNKYFFEQFHAETTYSDFIYGIKPKLNTEQLSYEENKGILYKAIEYAQQHKNEKVLLIIDEINRANLSNVLGPVFYLFEKKDSNHQCSFSIGSITLSKLPENLFVIATMNTADRSLAVVDFALRRRFTWLTLKPHSLKDDKKISFQETYFTDFEDIFQDYATDDEMNLQPGQSYFIAKDEAEMKERLQYEIMPLIKEYLNEGYLKKARDVFSDYFYNKLGVLMYE